MSAPTYAEILANRDTILKADGSRRKVTPGELWRVDYCGTAGTVRILPARYAGGPVRCWFTHDVDPGCGPMAYEAGAGIVLLELVTA